MVLEGLNKGGVLIIFVEFVFCQQKYFYFEVCDFVEVSFILYVVKKFEILGVENRDFGQFFDSKLMYSVILLKELEKLDVFLVVLIVFIVKFESSKGGVIIIFVKQNLKGFICENFGFLFVVEEGKESLIVEG